MLDRIRNYFYDRRRGFTTLIGAAGTIYVVGQYVLQRLEEAREQVLQDRAARDNLKRRFQQNQQDVSYQIMALMPALADQLLSDMNVEEVIADLQSKSRAARHHPTPSLESSIASSAELQSDMHSDGDSVSVISSVGNVRNDLDSSSLQPTESSSSWVEQFAQSQQQAESTSSRGASPIRNVQMAASPLSSGASLSDSIATDASSEVSSVPESQPHPEAAIPEILLPDPPIAPSSKTKAELWNEVKILTFTRTLCVLYATSLLSLFTTVQLNLIGRSKYIQSILQLERDEKLREQMEFDASISSLFWGGVPDERGLEADIPEDLLRDVQALGEETERKYLTLSWWLLHLGYKDVGERVRRAVEETLASVSLKTMVSVADIHRMVQDVRRRVEFEVNFERQERRTNFLSAVLPHTPETLQHVLLQGGIPPSLTARPDTAFESLLSETHHLVRSRDFDRVLEACLDRATEVLFDSLRANVFATSDGLALNPDAPLVGLAEMAVLPEDEAKLRLAGLLPGLAHWSNLALTGLPNELVDSITSVREMSAFSAIIYSSFEDRFR